MRRLLLVVVVALVLVTGCRPAPAPSRATHTPIRGSAVASVHHARQWATNHGAPGWFVNLANIYWVESRYRGGVRPDVAYAQAAKETGFGRFGGSVTASYHNPCGLKTRTGGPDGNGSSHQRFPNWTTGIRACLDHLALYAGAPGYPRAGSPDPRHFSSIRGDAVYVQQLGTRWAPSRNYGVSIVQDYLIPMRHTRLASASTAVDAPPPSASPPSAEAEPASSPTTTTTTTTTTAPPPEVGTVPALEPAEPECPLPAAEPGWRSELTRTSDGELIAVLEHDGADEAAVRVSMTGPDGRVEDEVEGVDGTWRFVVSIDEERIREAPHVLTWEAAGKQVACLPLHLEPTEDDNGTDGHEVHTDTTG